MSTLWKMANTGRTVTVFREPGKAVELGVRPEDIIVEKCESHDGVNFGSVSMVEPLGDCKLLHIAIGLDPTSEDSKPSEVSRRETAKLVCKVEPRTNIVKGDDVRLRFHSEHVHLFDTASGDNLTLDRG